jgi:hypothetical protein
MRKCRLEDFQKYMDRFANPPSGKPAAYYVVLRPMNLSPKQVDIMYQVAQLMIEQNVECVPALARECTFFLSR